MGLSAVTIEQFPGLDLRADPGDARSAIDLQNVTLEPGRVRVRDGLASGFPSTNVLPYFAGEFNLPDPHIIIGSVSGVSTALNVISTTGAVGAALTGLPLVGAEGLSGQAVGFPTGSFFYVSAVNVAGFGVRRWNGAIWNTPAGIAAVPGTQCLGISPVDNRLVLCGNSSTGCKVSFSNAGAVETYGANDYVLLTPGDGEEIQGTAVYANQLFVFKQTKFFVFYGNTTDAAGNTQFNYRTVATGVGMQFPAPQSVTVGPDGVYFVANDGIYRTDGGRPVKMSQALDPFFAGTTHPFWNGGAWAQTSMLQRLKWHDNKLYASLAGKVFVYDFLLQAWTYWISGKGAIVSFAAFPKGAVTVTVRGVAGVAADVRGLMLGVGGAVSGALHRVTSGITDDNGELIVSRYQLPFESYGSPGQKRLRETILAGSGTLNVSWAHDFSTTGTSGSVVMPAAPNITAARQRIAQRGRTFSMALSAPSGYWALNRVQANVSDALRQPEIAAP